MTLPSLPPIQIHPYSSVPSFFFFGQPFFFGSLVNHLTSVSSWRSNFFFRQKTVEGGVGFGLEAFGLEGVGGGECCVVWPSV